MELTEIVVQIMNFVHRIFWTRKSNFKWENSAKTALSWVDEFAKGQFTKIYGSIESRYKYHPLQMYENAIRQFNVTDSMRASMQRYGNVAFYQSVCGISNPDEHRNEAPDFTRINDLSTVTTAADYLYQQVYQLKTSAGEDTDAATESAEIARTNYTRGFTRTVSATDHADWERLRNELRGENYNPETIFHESPDAVALIAVSYKKKDAKIINRMVLRKSDVKKGTKDGKEEDSEDGIEAQTMLELTSDFLDDFRWSQLVRLCMEIARHEDKPGVRLWIDQLVMKKYERQEISRRYNIVKWEEFALLPYALCPVVRLYDKNEKYFGTEFWRKLEAVLGVAGKGIFVDDYMLRKFDETIFYGHEMYESLSNGISRIGGKGTYVRATTLALATAILTDGVTTTATNEDKRTKEAVGGWKAWALRTIGEGAYSSQHFSMLTQEVPFQVGMDKFLIIAFWESMVSRSNCLTGNSYLDMSWQRSMTWKKSSCWDGVLEWIGMIENSCEIVDREVIKEFIKNNVDIELWASTTGHVASWMALHDGRRNKRSIVVDLARYSSARHGHVTAVAEATGLWKESFLSPWLKHVPLPDEDQSAKISHEGTILYEYKPMTVTFIWGPASKLIGLGLINAALVFLSMGLWSIAVVIQIAWHLLNWPWVDRTDVGEALFDNLLLNSLYGSGIKKQYRRLQEVKYNQIRWN